jgi:putative aminopeptidase FrvX
LSSILPVRAATVEYVVEQLGRLCLTPSPAGHTEAAVRLLEAELDRLHVSHSRTTRGALIASVPGREAGPHRTLTGHVDTLAAMVTKLEEDGTLRLTQVGSYAPGSIEGEYCTIETAAGKRFRGTVLFEKPSAHVSKDVVSARRELESMIVRVDAEADKEDDLRRLGIAVGDYIHFDPRFERTDTGFVKSRHLDDKAGVACMLGALAGLVEGGLRPKRTTHFYFSTSEEVGFGASSGIPDGTTQLVAVDMGAVGKGQESDEFSVAICAKDSSGPFDYRLRRHLVELCTRFEIPCKVDVYPFYQSDAAAAVAAGADVLAALIGPGISASHNLERTHRRALDATVRLITAFVEPG